MCGPPPTPAAVAVHGRRARNRSRTRFTGAVPVPDCGSGKRTRFTVPGCGHGQRMWIRTRPLEAVCCPGAYSPSPAFAVASRSRSVLFRRGDILEIGRQPPLRKTTSAAYGVGRDSIADALAERCPVRHSPQRLRLPRGCPVENAMPGTRRFEGLGALGVGDLF